MGYSSAQYSVLNGTLQAWLDENGRESMYMITEILKEGNSCVLLPLNCSFSCFKATTPAKVRRCIPIAFSFK